VVIERIFAVVASYGDYQNATVKSLVEEVVDYEGTSESAQHIAVTVNAHINDIRTEPDCVDDRGPNGIV
jgi:hypothetical protein